MVQVIKKVNKEICVAKNIVLRYTSVFSLIFVKLSRGVMTLKVKNNDHINRNISNFYQCGNLQTKVSEKLKHYIKEHCPGRTVEEVGAWLNKNEELINHFNNRTEHLISKSEKKEYFLGFVWGLMAAAVERDEGFRQGTIKFEDEPDYRIAEFFRPIAYLRPSSHYKGRVIIKSRVSWLFNAYAIDDDRFPAGHRTAIFAPVATLKGEKKYSFLKTEDHSAHPLRPLEFGKHFIDYLKSRPRAYNWQSRIWSIFQDPHHRRFREEDMPGELKEEILEILNTAPKTDRRFGCVRVHPKKYARMVKHVLARVNKYGIAGVWEAAQNVVRVADEQAGRRNSSESDRDAWRLWSEKIKLVQQRVEDLYPDDFDVRKGKEVVLPSPLASRVSGG